MSQIDSKIPEGPLAEKWTNYKAHQKLVNPANKRKLTVIVVGTGLAGASAAASLGKDHMPDAAFFAQDIMTRRPEQLTVAQFVDLTNRVAEVMPKP